MQNQTKKSLYIEIDEKSELEWLLNLFQNTLNANPNNQFKILNYEHIVYWHDRLSHPVPSQEIEAAVVERHKVATSTTRRTAKKKAPKKVTKEDKKNPLICVEHPTYTGTRVPRKDCDKCWGVYKQFHPMEYTVKRREFERKLRNS